MEEVGIITIIDNNNYGIRLQNYALQEIVKRFNLNTITVKNDPLFNNKMGRIKIFLNILRIIKQRAKILINIPHKRRRCFSKFDSNIEFSNTYFNINKSDPKYNYLVVGSDQVWNPTFGRLSDLDLTMFCTNAKRISYAASFGISELPKQYEEKAKSSFEKFDNISVREDAGKSIIQKLTGREDVLVLIDPTMLLTSEEWDKVSKKPTQLEEGKKYILNYFLGELSAERKEEIERIAKENNCEVISILDKKSPFYQTGPSEFLYLQKNAFLICTDSFHSCVFAMLYNRPFVIFDREENVVSMNSRIDTLLSKFNLKNRKFNKTITKENLNHDYTEAYKILDEERKKSIQFLQKALNIKE